MSTILKIARNIDNDIWKIVFSVDSAKFSETDKQLIAKFGEPEINVGGIFLGPTPGQEDQTYTAVSGTSDNEGTGATFTVARNALGEIAEVEVISSGAGYLSGDTITISGTAIGGNSPTDDLVITVDEVEISDLSGSVVGFVGVGSTISIPSDQEAQTYTAISGTSDNEGTGATFTLSRDAIGALTSIVLTAGGTGYVAGESITVLGNAVGGTAPADNVVITVNSVNPSNLVGSITTIEHDGGTLLGPINNFNEYTLPEKYIKIRSGLPFVQEFDSRGAGGMFSNNTQIKAEAFQERFVERYTAALTDLRSNTDSFTKELLINI